METDRTVLEALGKEFRAKDVLLAMYKEHADQARHHELQRERMIAAIVAVSSAILALMSRQEPPGEIHPWLCLALIWLGMYGAAFSRKHYERNRLHTTILGEYRQHLEAHFPESALTILRARAESAHDQRFWLFSQLPLNSFWTVLPLTVAALGAYLLWRKCSNVLLIQCFA